jgi:beta-N-acetylhexosaminidase
MKFHLILVLLAVLFSLGSPALAAPLAQTATPQSKARLLLNQLTPEEKVGQLFMITFNGTDVSDRSTVYTLVTKRSIGGFVLSRKNNNFNDTESVLRQTSQLTTAMQNISWSAIQKNTSGAVRPYIPLLLGLSQEGDLYPGDQILSGISPQPNLMAIGATWNPELARESGVAMGKEMSALGFNLFFGPSLDVLDTVYSGGVDDLGVRSFGGDPYWVSVLGSSYIQGLHEGSSGRLATIATHFPGRGSSDRSPEVEIPTIRKSLDQLKRVELAPFFAVTGAASSADATTDGLLLTHIRYQGFQGNIRDITTRPVSFDTTALNDILKLPAFTPWRDTGGLLVSDDLGSSALRKFFDPTGTNYDARQVARNALLAGNDLLYADNLLASGDADSVSTINRTLDFFIQKYREDTAFAQRVDAAVERILTLKYRLYPRFDVTQVVPSSLELSQVGSNQQVTFDVASKAATLISPDTSELANLLPKPPSPGERIVFITDEVIARQCSTCADRPMLAVDALQTAVVRLYGSQTGGQVSRNLLTSYSFTDLYQLLFQQPSKKTIEDDLRQANWVVFGVVKPSPDRPESNVLKRLLSEHPDLIRGKRLIVFSFNAPYYLDATDVSKLTAYYGIYGKSAPFVELAARILFQEHVPSGALPVSVPGTGYDLLTATSPTPNQVIALSLDLPDATPVGKGTRTPEPTAVPKFKLGDTLKLRTNVILDRNRNPVPDGTIVRFSFSAGATPGLAQTIEAQTRQGIARVSYKIERGELLQITARSDPAINSTQLLLDVTVGESVAITAITAIIPTSQPTLTPTVTITVTPSPTPTLTPTAVPPEPAVAVGDWMMAVGLALGVAAMLIWAGMSLAVSRWALRWGLCAFIGGLAGYSYFALKFPGSAALLKTYEASGVAAITILGAALGGIAGWLWQRAAIRKQPAQRSSGTTSPKG